MERGKEEWRKKISGIVGVLSEWKWRDIVLVLNTSALLIVVAVLSSYMNASPGADGSPGGFQSANQDGAASESSKCEAGGWLVERVSEGTEDPWLEMKVNLRAARCNVKGKWAIEELDPEHNFRRAYCLGFTGDIEDKALVLPYMLATQDGSLARRKRRVYIDFGGNMYKTSVYWMLRNYPVDFTEIYVFEVKDRLFVLPTETEQVTVNAMDNRSRRVIKTRDPNDIPKWMLDRIKVHRQFVSNRDDPAKNYIDATRFIKEELKLTEDDTVIVKMDIEGAEWDILPMWIKDGEMANIVDELFVEIHYSHRSMKAFGWMAFPHTRDEATNLLVEMRDRGFYVHTWP